MYTKSEIINIAKKQLALDFSCSSTDFDKNVNTIVEKKFMDGRRVYHNDGCVLKILCYGERAIFATNLIEMKLWLEEKFVHRNSLWLFGIPSLRTIDRKLNEYGHEIADVHHYYLPNPTIEEIQTTTNIKWYEQDEILQFENDERFDEAFAFDESHPDMLGVAAFEGDEIIGMAGASADSEILWQIGINVVKGHRSKGIATMLVTLLKNELLKRGKIPFYGTMESNILSQNVAIKAGFFPVWAELYSREVNKQGK